MTLEQIGGAALMALFLADIFLTILYARAGTGLLAPRWNRLVWTIVNAVARTAGRHRSTVLSFAGPLIVVSLIAFWALGLTLAAALIIRPELGTAIRPSSGDTPTDMITALLVAGNSLSIVGGGDYAPHTTGTRLLFLLNSLIGASVLSLVLSYLVQVYSALHERNALALTIDLMTGETGDAAQMLARLGPGGDFSDATSALDNLVRPLAMTKEAHHFYPLLFYFRFSEPRYSVSRICFVLLDLTALIETGLDRHKYQSLVGSAPVGSLRRCALLLLETLDRHFPTRAVPAASLTRRRKAARSSFLPAISLEFTRASCRRVPRSSRSPLRPVSPGCRPPTCWCRRARWTRSSKPTLASAKRLPRPNSAGSPTRFRVLVAPRWRSPRTVACSARSSSRTWSRPAFANASANYGRWASAR